MLPQDTHPYERMLHELASCSTRMPCITHSHAWLQHNYHHHQPNPHPPTFSKEYAKPGLKAALCACHTCGSATSRDLWPMKGSRLA
jgi:hypothetical protein